MILHQGYTGQGTTWANKMNFVMNHAPTTLPGRIIPRVTILMTWKSHLKERINFTVPRWLEKD